MTQKIPYGISDFKKLITSDCYFVDKSLFIQEIIDNPAEVIILPRPRRFGKTLNMTMLRYFLESSDEDRSEWFTQLKIGAIPTCMAQLGTHPVIFLTLKDLKEKTWEQFIDAMKALMSDVYLDFQNQLDFGQLETPRQKYAEKIVNCVGSELDLKRSLLNLSRFIFQ